MGLSNHAMTILNRYLPVCVERARWCKAACALRAQSSAGRGEIADLPRYHAGLAVNGFARSALASLTGRLRPLTAALRRGPHMTGNLAQITTRTTLMNSIDTTSQKIEAREVA